jgi:hypothetical protein
MYTCHKRMIWADWLLGKEVKISLCLTKHHAMKVYWGSGGISPRILDLGTWWRWAVSFTSGPLYPEGKRTWYPLDRKFLPLHSSGATEENLRRAEVRSSYLPNINKSRAFPLHQPARCEHLHAALSAVGTFTCCKSFVRYILLILWQTQKQPR